MRSQRRSIARIHNQAAQAAIQQIKKKKYSDTWKDYTGEVVLVGINYITQSIKVHIDISFQSLISLCCRPIIGAPATPHCLHDGLIHFPD